MATAKSTTVALWELQDQQFAFCGWFGIDCIFSTEFSTYTWSVLRCVRPRGNENLKRSGYCGSRSRNPRQCTLQISGNTLQQVEKFKYLGVVFTSDGRRNKEIDTRIGEANAALCEPFCSVVTKRELSNTAKLSVFKSVFVPIFTYVMNLG